MSNYDRAHTRDLTFAALDVALGEKPEPVVIKTQIDMVFYKTMLAQGLDAAVKQYLELKKNQPEKYDFQEQLLNNLGYQLMRQGKLTEAIRVLQMNVVACPSSSNVYDSLGEAYMKNGEKASAIENYERSLKLNPANTSAVEMLKKLRAP